MWFLLTRQVYFFITILFTSHPGFITIFLLLIFFLSFPQRDASGQPDQIIKNMPEMTNLVYNMYMHMIQTSQKYKQVKPLDEYTECQVIYYCIIQNSQQYCCCLIGVSSKTG